MSPERWQRIEQLYHAALERAAAQRATFLAEACADDAALRREVEALLAANEQASGFLASPALEVEAKNLAAAMPAPAPALEVGQELSHYKILSPIGAGGMGEVFLAQDRILERRVALKLLPVPFTQDAERLQRFIREAKAASALNHPNIITIYEIGEVNTARGKTHFMATEYIEGETLRTWRVDEEERLRQALNIAKQIASALDAAHKAGIVHRDIKPENVIVRPDGLVKVLDFGLAKLTTASIGSIENEAQTLIQALQTQQGIILGTLRYMSPEQARGRSVDARSDIFSLGVVLYELLTAQPLFAAETEADVAVAIIHKQAPPLANYLSEVPVELERIVQKALAKDKEQRYQDARDLQIDLKNLQKHLEFEEDITRDSLSRRRHLATQPISGIILSRLTRGRRLFIPVAAATLALVLMVYFGVSRWQGAPYRPSADVLHWYTKGTEALRDGAYYTASKAFERAVEMDNRFALAHARLAEAYMEIDAGDRAKEEMLAAIALVPDRAVLPKLDALYLDALAATVRRELGAAIEYYQKLAEQSPEAEKASAYIDLGRAYERDENIDKAIEFYQAAARMNSQSAGALLRLAILYGRKQDFPHATEAFDKAEKTYQALSNLEGVAEVLFQRGTMLNKIGKVQEARAKLEKALAIARQTNNTYQQVSTQLQLSLVYIEENTELASRTAKQAIDLAQTNNLRNLAVNGLIDLGYTFAFRGEYEEAGKSFNQALDFARAAKARKSEARALLALGSLDVQRTNYDEGVPLLEQALAFYQPSGYRKEASLALTMLGRAQRSKGNYEDAINIFNQQLRVSEELGDTALVANSHLSLALTLGLDQERYPEALPHIEASYQINESSGSPLNSGYDEMSRAEILWQLGRYDEAGRSLKQALLIASRPEASYKGLQAWVHLIDSRMALSQRRLAEARKEANQALELAGAEDRDLTIQAKSCVGLAEALAGAPRLALPACEEAIAIAREIKNPRLVASALLALSEALLLANDAPAAQATALQAQEMLARAGRQDSEWRALLVAGRASQLAGNRQEAADYASRADRLLTALQQKWPAEIFAGYLKRPDIQAYRNQLAQLLRIND